MFVMVVHAMRSMEATLLKSILNSTFGYVLIALCKVVQTALSRPWYYNPVFLKQCSAEL